MMPFPQPYHQRLRVVVTFLLLTKEDDVCLSLISLINFIKILNLQ